MSFMMFSDLSNAPQFERQGGCFVKIRVFLVCFFILGGRHAPALAAASNEKSALQKGVVKAEVQKITIKTNVDAAQIFSGERSLGASGASLVVDKGVHHLVVRAKGYSPRGFMLDPDKFTAKELVIKLVPVSSEISSRRDPLIIPFLNGLKVDDSFASICSIGGVTDEFRCSRQKILEDIYFSGVLAYDASRIESIDREAALKVRQQSLAELASDSAFTDKLYYNTRLKNPGHEGVTALLARLFLLSGECSKMNDLVLENFDAKGPIVEAITLTALCYERVSRKDIASSLLDRKLEVIEKSPYYSYHKARGLFLTHPKEAQKIFTTCIKDYPTYYPCYELAALFESSQQRSTVKVMRLYVRRNQGEEGGQLQALLRLRKEGKLKEAYDLAQKYSMLHQHSYELNVFKVLLEGELGNKPRAALFTEESRYYRILNSDMARYLSEEGKKIFEPDLYQQVIRGLIRLYPNEPKYWTILLDSYEANGKCDRLIDAARESYAFIPKSTKLVLSLREGSCLVKLSRLQEAIDCYFRVVNENPQNFSGFYNLGATYERQKKYSEALLAFKKASERRPPNNMLQQLNDKIEYLEKKIKMKS